MPLRTCEPTVGIYFPILIHYQHIPKAMLAWGWCGMWQETSFLNEARFLLLGSSQELMILFSLRYQLRGKVSLGNGEVIKLFGVELCSPHQNSSDEVLIPSIPERDLIWR